LFPPVTVLRRALWALLLPSLAACAGTVSPLALRATPPARDAAALSAAVESFYSARDVPAMRAAVAAAAKAGPETALHHEIAGRFAILEGRVLDYFEHLYAALRDPADDAMLLHLLSLNHISWTLSQRERAESLLAGLARDHSDPVIRATAAHYLAVRLHRRNQREARDEMRRVAGEPLPFAVIGCWDNDQGKGYDAVLPPEEKVDLAGRYPGSLLEARWREDPPRDEWTRIDFHNLLSPNTWSVAYAASAVRSAAGGEYELRLSTSVPIKVWVNGSLVLAARGVIQDNFFDQFVVPVRLRSGANQVLVKSAHGTGQWMLFARITGPDGAPAQGLTPLRAGTPAAPGPAPSRSTVSALLEKRVAGLVDGARRAFHRVEWARMSGLRGEAVGAAETLLQRYPGSLVGRQRLGDELWDKGDRDRTADVLGELTESAGAALPLLTLQQARFWQQQGFRQKARTALLAVRDAHPELPLVWQRLADHFRVEGWNEDRCAALQTAQRKWPGWTGVELEFAECQAALGFPAASEEIYERILKVLPAAYAPRVWLVNRMLLAGDFSGATAYARRNTEAYPSSRAPWLHLAEVRRRAGDRPGAEEALRRALRLNPDAADAWEALGQLYWQAGDKARAVEHWKGALLRNPKNERLAHRLEFLAPTAEGAPWSADVPDERVLQALVDEARRAAPAPGADVLQLLDDGVIDLKSDGSTVSVVTQVAHALNQRGRDQLTHYRTPRGALRILHAYAVDRSGRRSEASSIRAGNVRFRGLQVGSTIVLQYRFAAPPVGYLSRHLAQEWWFQMPSRSILLSRLVIWAPKGSKFHEDRVGANIKREERVVGDKLRVAWSAANTPALPQEPLMPPLADSAMHLLVSTVPDWDTYLRWEAALLQDAFRESPELIAFADRLFQGATDTAEKVARIQRHLAEEIRYQQDYESHIAGVKPHPAPMVLQRGYGDCKDKAVLFITLARRAGIDAHYVLLRTRPRGVLRQTVPMQQFDHAIVYVPQQGNLTESRFYDPTADALDLGVLPQADAGAMSLVLDPKTGQHAWRQIPLQPPEANETRFKTELRLAADGTGQGQMEVTAQGQFGAMLRRTARNSEQLTQLLQNWVSRSFSGGNAGSATLLNTTDLRRPAAIRMPFQAPNAGRREGATMRVKTPVSWPLREVFSLPTRKHPLYLGAPMALSWSYEVSLPAGHTVKKLPDPGRIEARCIALDRQVRQEPGRVVVDQRISVRCETVDIAEYPQHRTKVEEMTRLLEDDLVLESSTK
jgi:tetratricopeptide (TPR) repeat protein/transglutaminase-like putative cysteine protease